MHLRFLIHALVALVALGGCDRTTRGENGVIEFTPDDCGALSCDLSDGLAADSTLAILLEFTDDRDSLDRATLVSDNPSIVEVTGETGVINPRFRIKAHGPGEARLSAVAHEYGGLDHSDAITVRVFEPDDIAIDVTSAGEPERVDAATDRYRFPAGTHIRISSRPVAAGRELTGETVYECTIGSELAATVGTMTNFTRGEIDARPPAGTHVVTIQLSTGARRVLELIAD